MKFAFFESLVIGYSFYYHFQEYVKINDREAKRTSDNAIRPFNDNTVIFPVFAENAVAE